MDIQVGDKVTYKIREIVYTQIVENSSIARKIKNNVEYEIIKIERPKYEVIGEMKELLTEEEREFLRKALKFGNYGSDTENGTVKFIIKNGYFIELYYEDWAFNTIYIDKKLYFKNLEQDKQYTLQELGLE